LDTNVRSVVHEADVIAMFRKNADADPIREASAIP